MASLKELIVKIGADTKGLDAGVDGAKAKLAGLQTAGEGLAAIGTGLTIGLTAPIVAMGTAALTAGGQMEQARMSFETMLGSAEASATFLKQLEDFAKSTPFQFEGLVQSSKQMLAFGFAAKDVIPNLTAVGDAIAAVGGGDEAIQGVIRALGQMSQKGKVSAEEINQLAERGIGAWKYLAEAAGVSIADVQKLAEKGALDAGIAIQTILAGMSGEFGGLMEKQAQTLLGQLSNLQDTFGQALTRLGEVLIPFAIQAVGLAAQMADGFASAVDVFASMPQPVQAAAVAFAGILAAIGPLIGGIGALMVGWATLGPSITAAGSVLAAVATGPVGIAIAAIAALTAGYFAFGDQLTFLDPILSTLGDAFDTVKNAVVALVYNFEPLVVGIGVFASEIYHAIPGLATFFGWIGDKLLWAFTQVGSILKAVLIVQLEGMGKVLGWVAEKAEALFGYFVDKGKKALDDTGKATADAAKETKDLGDKLKGVEATAKAAVVPTRDFSGIVSGLVRNAQSAKAEVFNLDKAVAALNAQNKEAETIAKAAAQALARDMGGAAVDLKVNVQALTSATQGAMTSIQEWTATAADSWDAAAMKAAATANEVDAAFSAMGLKTTDELHKIAADAATNFDLIAGSGKASAETIDAAWIKMLQARQAALQANGESLGVEEQKILDNLLERQRNHGNDSKSIWQEWGEGIKGVMSNLDLGGKLFSGGFAPSNIKETLKGIGNQFKDALAKPAIDAINNLIDKGIKVLLGALDGVIGKLIGSGGVQSAFGAAFGIGGGGGSGPSIPGVGGGGPGGAAGSIAGAGINGAVSMVTGAVSAVSGVVSNFQFAAMNKSLDLIETEARETKLWIETNVAPALWQINEAVSWGPLVKATEALSAFTQGVMFQKIDGIFAATSWGPNVKANERSAEELSGLRGEIAMLAAKLEQLVTRDIVVAIDGQEIARAVGAGQESLRATA